jgi:hypothetical protein
MIAARLQSRIALGLSPTPRPGLVLLPLGLALGPSGLNVLSDTILSYLDPAVSVALATLGVFAGLGLDLGRPREGRLLTAASVEAGVTILFVGGGLLAIQTPFTGAGLSPWLIVLLFGVPAAVSSTTAADRRDRTGTLAARVSDLDDVLPICLSGLVIASLPQGLSAAAVSLTVQAALAALVIALAGWLLLSQASAEGEQHVFIAGTLLLLGGAAAYLSVSALWIGLAGGLLWGLAGGPARESIDRDLRYLQHPFVVLLLLVAGARLQLSALALAIAAIYLSCRLLGKLMGAWLARRIVEPDLPSDLGRRLVAPGVIAVAAALNVVQADANSDQAGILLAVAVLGSLGSELLAIFVYPHERLP